MPKKRAPGGGRKPQGEFTQLTSFFGVRMPDDLRKQLERAAVKNKRSVSQELLARLNSSLARDRDKDRDPALRGLLYLIANLAENLSREGPAAEFETYWRTHWKTFRAFKIAVGKLLDALEPPEPPEDPAFRERWRKTWEEVLLETGHSLEFAKWFIGVRETPEALGAFEFSRLLEAIHNTAPPSESQRELFRALPQYERDFYTLPKAWKALELKKPKSK